jgi:hypothetical protein
VVERARVRLHQESRVMREWFNSSEDVQMRTNVEIVLFLYAK